MKTFTLIIITGKRKKYSIVFFTLTENYNLKKIAK